MSTLRTLLEPIYPPDAIDLIYDSLQLSDTQKPLQSANSENLQFYVTYPHAFCENGYCGLNQLTEQLSRLKKLGMNAIHVLPPFESPMIDNGFDVSDYFTIRSEIGGNEAFDAFVTKAKQLDFRVFVDFVLNHISDQHTWFKQAIAGDTYYQRFFFTLSQRPQLLSVFQENTITYARYKINENTHDIRVIFPDQAGEIPHWVEHNGLWYFHTFYPQQIDLDWRNPQVFIEMAKILIHWTRAGCDFRLDAVSHIGKRWDSGMQKGNIETHLLVQALHHILKLTNPTGLFLVEVNARANATKLYAGTPTVQESDLMYHFELTECFWEAILLGETNRLWLLLEDFGQLPPPAHWVTFLRNHDALTIRFCEPGIKDRLFSLLMARGIVFREGNAVAGRTASLLDNDPSKIIITHLLLASLPGFPALMYGDEIGKANDIAYMKEQTRLKLNEGVHAEDDARDIGRGQITTDDLNTSNTQNIQNALAEIFTTRAQYPDLGTTIPQRLEPDQKNLFAAKYQLERGELHVFINLSDETITLQTEAINSILTIHDVKLGQGSVTLGAYSGAWLLDIN